MKINVENFIIRLLYMVAAGIVITQALGLKSLASLLFTGTFLLVLMLWFAVSQKRITKLNVMAIIIVVVAITNVLLNALFTGTILSFSYMKKVIMFSSTILFFVAASEADVHISNRVFINRMVNFVSCFLIIMYYLQSSSMHLFYGQVTNYLTFRFTNPNLTAMFLISMLFCKIINMLQEKRKAVRFLDFIIAAFLFKFMMETKSRNCMLVFAIFIMQMIVYYRMPKIKIFSKKIYAKIMAVWPLIFAIVYMLVVQIPVISQIFSFMISEGKGITSRYRLWSSAFKFVYNSPIIGAYSQISMGTGESHMHNSHMEVMASYGVLVLIIVCVFLYTVIWNKIRSNSSAGNMLYNISFASVLLVGMGEAALFSGGIGVYLFVGMLLLFNNDKSLSGDIKLK